MKKKILFLGFLLPVAIFLVASFLFWQDQKEVWALNKTLPQGVAVSKNPLTKEYHVNNKIDGYSFKVPSAWKGISEIEYIPEKQVSGMKSTGVGITGKNGNSSVFSLDVFYLEQGEKNLLEQAQNLWKSSGLIGDLKESLIGNFSIVKGTEEVHLGGTYVYFFKTGKKMYVLNNGSEDFIKEIIVSGQW